MSRMGRLKGAIVFTLAYYTKDAGQIDRMFRGSGLMRDKWDAQHGEKTYGSITIDKALGKVTKQYTPNPRNRTSSSRTSTPSLHDKFAQLPYT